MLIKRKTNTSTQAYIPRSHMAAGGTGAAAPGSGSFYDELDGEAGGEFGMGDTVEGQEGAVKAATVAVGWLCPWM